MWTVPEVSGQPPRGLQKTRAMVGRVLSRPEESRGPGEEAGGHYCNPGRNDGSLKAGSGPVAGDEGMGF